MSQGHLFLELTFILNMLLGVIVFATNPSRGANQQFLTLSITTGTWLFSLLMTFGSKTAETAKFWIQITSVAGIFLPSAFTLLRYSIRDPESSFLATFYRARFSLVIYLFFVILCFTPLYLVKAVIPPHGVPDAVYGPLSWLYHLYIFAAPIWLIRQFVKDLQNIKDVQRGELQFVLLALVTLIVVGLCFAVLVPVLTKNSQSVSLAPLWVILMNCIIAYGIATRKIMDVGVLVRRGVSYLLLIGYLTLVYLSVWWITYGLANFLDWKTSLLPHIIGTIVVVFAVSQNSVQNFLQFFIQRLFINFREINLRDVLKSSDSVLSTVTTTSDLLTRFVQVLKHATGTEFVSIQLFNIKTGKNTWSTLLNSPNVSIDKNSPLALVLRETGKPFLGSIIHRRRPSFLLLQSAKQLKELNSTLAIGIHSKNDLEGIVLLGEKLSGRVYNDEQQETLQIVVNRLSTAIENAKLYTEIQNSKVYVETLLDQLVNGVIATNKDGKITVFNKEAQRVLQLEEDQILGRSVHLLPQPLAQGFLKVLGTQEIVRDVNVNLVRSNGTMVPIRYGSQLFGNDPIGAGGALLVIEDLTQVKKLEEQLRRADRLSSLGTLSASVAHEIKNPLVAIKTFVQLIPERKADIAFLDRFTRLVGGEVKRIDEIVNQLLSFARIGEQRFSWVSIHELLDNTLLLMHHDFVKKSILLGKNYQAVTDKVWADKQKLEQVLLNLVINSHEAMEGGGRITVETQNVIISPPTNTESKNGTNLKKPYLMISLQDEGPGIDPEHLSKIFDPFFSTKEMGTGLGLSIAYGIITEHRGTIDITSKPNCGTRVQIHLPLDQKSDT